MKARSDLAAHVAAQVIDARDALNELDALAGDGDMGVTMSRAAEVVREIMTGRDADSLAAVLGHCGQELASKVPSTSGTLLATAFLRASRFLEPGLGAPSDTHRLAAVLEAVVIGIQERGKARPGDRTMLDALVPAVDALRDACAQGAALDGALAQAAAAAARGAAATASMVPRAGRGKWLAERATGHVDAGAHLVALVFAACQQL